MTSSIVLKMESKAEVTEGEEESDEEEDVNSKFLLEDEGDNDLKDFSHF